MSQHRLELSPNTNSNKQTMEHWDFGMDFSEITTHKRPRAAEHPKLLLNPVDSIVRRSPEAKASSPSKSFFSSSIQSTAKSITKMPNRYAKTSIGKAD